MRQLKTQLARYLRAVEAGDSLTVTVRNRPIAKVIPIRMRGDDDEKRLNALVAKGVLRPSRRKPRPAAKRSLACHFPLPREPIAPEIQTRPQTLAVFGVRDEETLRVADSELHDDLQSHPSPRPESRSWRDCAKHAVDRRAHGPGTQPA